MQDARSPGIPPSSVGTVHAMDRISRRMGPFSTAPQRCRCRRSQLQNRSKFPESAAAEHPGPRCRAAVILGWRGSIFLLIGRLISRRSPRRIRYWSTLQDRHRKTQVPPRHGFARYHTLVLSRTPVLFDCAKACERGQRALLCCPGTKPPQAGWGLIDPY